MEMAQTDTTNQGKARYATYYMAHDPETFASIGDPVRVAVISSYSDAPNLMDKELEAAKAWAIKVCHYPVNAVWMQMEDENYPDSVIECDADEFRYNDGE